MVPSLKNFMVKLIPKFLINWYYAKIWTVFGK